MEGRVPPAGEMDYRFREIRKGEREAVLGFVKERGCTIEPQTLHHHMSLMVRADDNLVAAALCLEQAPAQFVIEIAHADGVDDTLITQLTDRCLRKMQSERIASARINSPAQTATQTIWQSANWLDRIKETPPDDSTAASVEPITVPAA